LATLADVGWPPGPPPRDDQQDVLDEAFALAAFNGGLEALERLLELGADVSGAVHLGLAALHLAVMGRRLETARWLVAHGADRDRRDQIHHGTALGWAEHNCRDSAIHRLLEDLGGARGRGVD
jgi:ankyrin repeat protein